VRENLFQERRISMKNKGFVWLVIISGVLTLGIAHDVLGKEKVFPSKPIELVCPFGPGGSTSMGGRVIAGTMAEFIGAPVVVIYKTGGGGTVGPTSVLKSKPDGYTLLIAPTGPTVITPVIRSTGYKLEDFEFLGQYAMEPMGLVVRSDAPWKTVEELITYAKKNPGTLKLAIDGLGTPSNFAMEILKISAGGLKIDSVPFLSSAETITAVLGGHVQMTYAYLTSAKGPYEGGRIRILAVGTDKRLEDYPGVPTFSEIGYPEVKWGPFFALAAPHGVPKQVMEKLKDALYKTAQNPEVQKLLAKIGFIPIFRTAEEFTKFAKEERERVIKFVKETGFKVD
jgi:tripartite-type tricarboxylate transporter receptor subunit TctC